MPQVQRVAYLYVVSRRALSPKMPALSPFHLVVGALFNSLDYQARALSVCRRRALHVHHLDSSARALVSSDRPFGDACTSVWFPTKTAHLRNFPSSDLAAVHHVSYGCYVGDHVNPIPNGKERLAGSVWEDTSGEGRFLSRSLFKASLASRNVPSVDRFSSSRFFKGFTPSCGHSTAELLPGFASIAGFDCKQFNTVGHCCVGNNVGISNDSSAGPGTSIFINNPENEYNTSKADQRFAGGVAVELAQAVGSNDSRVEVSASAVPGDRETSGDVENVADATSSERGRGTLHRRRRGVGSPGQPGSTWEDLMTVPGIGRRNMEKLVANGIAKLDELKQLYRDKYQNDGTEKMVEFLRSSVGVQKHHATSITAFIKTAVDAEDGSTDSGAQLKKRLTFCVEGNISVGKTTFLHRIANETIELRDLVEIVPEPIGKWQDVGPNHFNILDAFYGDPERYAYTFQNYVFVTRMMQERESAVGEKRLRLMERSVFSDRMVFVRAVHEAKWMSDAEISIYDSWFDPVVSAMPGLVPDAFIYLRATPDTCHRRLQSRKRKEEDTVTLDYLRGLHEKHEQWLLPAQHNGSSVLSVSEWASGHQEPLSPRLKDRVLYLKGENVHSSIQKVPALVLDCEPSIDFSRDLEAKAEYARQVADFFEYVQSLKDRHPDGRNDSSSLLLPGSTGALGPEGTILRPNSVQGMDFRRQISSICA